MIFLDNPNFVNSVRCLYKDREQDRVIDYHNLNSFVINFLSKNPKYEKETLFHVRTYYYDGEYTGTLINRIKQHLQSIPVIVENHEEIHNLKELIKNTERRLKGQKKEVRKMESYYFFETRLKPLQYSKAPRIFQKGVDVQLAVDLVSNAYLNNYDIAVLFSGDIDLYESIKLVKTLGKQVIIFSHNSLMARGMVEIGDFYKDLCWLKDEQLDEFTHIFEKR